MCQPGSTSSLCCYNPTLQPWYWRLIYTPILNQRWIWKNIFSVIFWNILRFRGCAMETLWRRVIGSSLPWRVWRGRGINGRPGWRSRSVGVQCWFSFSYSGKSFWVLISCRQDCSVFLVCPTGCHHITMSFWGQNFVFLESLLFDLVNGTTSILSRTVPSLLSLFQNPSKNDTGEYKCSVKNKWGHDHTTFALG